MSFDPSVFRKFFLVMTFHHSVTMEYPNTAAGFNPNQVFMTQPFTLAYRQTFYSHKNVHLAINGIYLNFWK